MLCCASIQNAQHADSRFSSKRQSQCFARALRVELGSELCALGLSYLCAGSGLSIQPNSADANRHR